MDGPTNGIFILGADDTRVYNNLVVGFMEHGIYANDQEQDLQARYRFAFNTIVGSGKGGLTDPGTGDPDTGAGETGAAPTTTATSAADTGSAESGTAATSDPGTDTTAAGATDDTGALTADDTGGQSSDGGCGCRGAGPTSGLWLALALLVPRRRKSGRRPRP